MHVHISNQDGEAKFWLEPMITLANSYNLSPTQLKELQKIVENRANEIRRVWEYHFAN